MTVYLVGAGPGDPGLLTLRGAEVLATAHVVVYDRLSIESLLDVAPPDAERISVGKTPRAPSTPQDDINRLLIEKGRAGLDVVRLKGGDPFVFARGGEEAAALAAAGVPFEVVPGVSSAVAVPAYAGVPVTHRGLSTSFTVVTGHEDPWAATETDWEAVARVGGTIVVLMGTATRADIAARLMAAGLDGATPVCAVQWGTRPEQHTVRTRLDSLGEAEFGNPAVIVIGAVAGLDLAWFERRPLFGMRVVATRAAERVGTLAARLRAAGADVVEVPTIVHADPSDGGAGLRAEVGGLATFDWAVFTSATAVERVAALVRDARAFGGCRVAAVGPGTAGALRRLGIVADLVPERSAAAGLVEVFPEAPGGAGGRVLLPQSEIAAVEVAEGLRGRGWDVVVAAAYTTVAAPVPAERLEAARDAHAICFTSASTVRGWVEAAGPDATPPVVVSIGPATSAAARDAGLAVTAEADPHSLDGLVAALIATRPV